ncbi:MAG: carbohydrate kinase [Actinobacteria bacterium]|nr:carbohydrate kinase [Actinomycetota bacterium]
MSKEIWVCGEALIDLIPRGEQKVAIVGGGPANTAKALARLGFDSYFIDGISTDSFGGMIKDQLLHDGVNLKYAHYSDKQTCTADVSLDKAGVASYVFTIDGTATFDFTNDWLPDPAQIKPVVLQIGTLATIVQPAADVLLEWAKRVAKVAPIVFDPNVRSSVLPDRPKYQEAIAKWAAISEVIKVSEDDLAWLYPEQDQIAIAEEWIKGGSTLVIITKGSYGIIGVTKDDVVSVPGVKIEVVDTVGAGDTVGAIVVEAIVERGLKVITGDVLREVLVRATKAAAVTCSRAGANPPTRAEIVG